MNTMKGNLAAYHLVSFVWISICIVTFIGFDGELSWVAITLFILFTYTSIMLWKTVLDRRVLPLEIMFWLFHTNFLLLPALSQSINRTFYWSSYSAYRQESLLYACLIIVIGLIAFNVGTWLGRRRLRKAARNRNVKNIINRPLTLRWPVVTLLISILIVLILLISNLGLDYYLSSRTSKLSQVESLAELGLLLNLPRALAIGVLLFTIALMVQRHRQKKTMPFTIMAIFIAAIGVNAIINYPLSIARFWLFGFLISLIWIVPSYLGKMWRSVFVVAMTVLQFTVFPWYSELTREKGGIDFNIESIRQYLHHGDFDGYQSIVNITQYIQDSGYELGRNLLSVVLFFVPRAIWDKAEPLGSATASYKGYVYTNLSAPIYGELYADFGILSLVLGMGIIGTVTRHADAYYNRMVEEKQFGIGILITGVVSGFMVIMLRGSLLGVVPGIATLLGLLLILSRLALHASPPPRV